MNSRVLPQEGLDRECEYPVKFGKYDVFANMKWLQTEVEKKQQQQYMEHRLKLYQQRCVVHGCCQQVQKTYLERKSVCGLRKLHRRHKPFFCRCSVVAC